MKPTHPGIKMEVHWSVWMITEWAIGGMILFLGYYGYNRLDFSNKCYSRHCSQKP